MPRASVLVFMLCACQVHTHRAGLRLRLRATHPQAASIRHGISPVLTAATQASSSPENEPAPAVFPCGDELDRRIGSLALPAVLNFLILPITQSVDLFFIGQLGSALAIAGQAAANQVFSTAAWTVSVIPVVTTPRVAKARAANDEAEVQAAVGEAIFIAVVLSASVAVGIGIWQKAVLTAAGNAAGLPFSLPYLRYRLPGLVFEAVSTVGFSAFRGVMDTVTPLQISLLSNLINLGLDPALMFNRLITLPGGQVVPGLGLGIAGAALATTASQLFAAAAYLRLMLARKLVRWGTLLRPPSRASLATLAKAGGAVQVRALALNAAFFTITKATQRLDATGTAAAAHAVTLQLWQLGGVILFALSTVASIVVPAELAKADGGGVAAARAAANRLCVSSRSNPAALGRPLALAPEHALACVSTQLVFACVWSHDLMCACASSRACACASSPPCGYDRPHVCTGLRGVFWRALRSAPASLQPCPCLASSRCEASVYNPSPLRLSSTFKAPLHRTYIGRHPLYRTPLLVPDTTPFTGHRPLYRPPVLRHSLLRTQSPPSYPTACVAHSPLVPRSLCPRSSAPPASLRSWGQSYSS